MKLFFCFLILVTTASFAAERKSYGTMAAGDTYSFLFVPTPNWHVESDGKFANEAGAHVVLWREKENYQSAQPLIYLKVINRKKNPTMDMDRDVKSALKADPKTNLTDLVMTNPQSIVAAKLFAEPDKTTEYVSYIYPNESKKRAILAVMHAHKRSATSEELKIYKDLIQSIRWIADESKMNH